MHETTITHEARKLGAPIDADVFEIKVLKRPRVALMKSDQDRHHLARMQLSRMSTGFTTALARKTAA